MKKKKQPKRSILDGLAFLQFDIKKIDKAEKKFMNTPLHKFYFDREEYEDRRQKEITYAEYSEEGGV